MPLDDPIDQAALKDSVESLEESSFLVELTGWAGKPIEYALSKLPQKASDTIESATGKALTAALRLAISSMDLQHKGRSSPWLHRAAATFTGGVGGMFGLPALAVELPLSTTIMLRSIADTARAEGEDLTDPASRLACIEVFALGGRTPGDDAAESGYFAVRAALAKSVSEAAAYVANKGAIEEGAPVIVRFVAQVARRFAPAVAEKVAAEAAPVIGAVGGAAVNLLFINHFQDVARGHFTVRRLERKYGTDRVRSEYDLLKSEHPHKP